MRIVSLATITKLAIGVMLMFMQCLLAQATEIKALGVVPLKTSIDVLAPQFERDGHKVTVRTPDCSDLIKRFAAGETFDVALVWPAMIDRLLKEGKSRRGNTR